MSGKCEQCIVAVRGAGTESVSDGVNVCEGDARDQYSVFRSPSVREAAAGVKEQGTSLCCEGRLCLCWNPPPPPPDTCCGGGGVLRGQVERCTWCRGHARHSVMCVASTVLFLVSVRRECRW